MIQGRTMAATEIRSSMPSDTSSPKRHAQKRCTEKRKSTRRTGARNQIAKPLEPAARWPRLGSCTAAKVVAMAIRTTIGIQSLTYHQSSVAGLTSSGLRREPEKTKIDSAAASPLWR